MGCILSILACIEFIRILQLPQFRLLQANELRFYRQTIQIIKVPAILCSSLQQLSHSLFLEKQQANNIVDCLTMKSDTSMKGLSEIMQESYKDEHENTKYQLAKLANQEFLMHYIQLDHNISPLQEYRYLLQAPLNPTYVKFSNTSLQREENIRKEVKKLIEESPKFKLTILSKEQLRELTLKKKQQSIEKEKLSDSRREKRENFFQKLKTSRKKDEQKMEQSKVQIKNKVDVTTEQTAEDIFLRLQIIGQQRDRLKKRWYNLGETTRSQEKGKIINDWNKNHLLMKELLQNLLEKLNRMIGISQVFKQLKIGDSSSVLSGLTSKTNLKSTNSLQSTYSERSLSAAESKLVYRFGSWFNKLLLDQRELDYIGSHHK